MLTSEQAVHESLRLKHDTLMSWRASKNFTPPHLFFFFSCESLAAISPSEWACLCVGTVGNWLKTSPSLLQMGVFGGEVEATVGGHPHDTFLAEEQSWKQTCFGARIPVNLCIRSPNPVDSQQHI